MSKFILPAAVAACLALLAARSEAVGPESAAETGMGWHLTHEGEAAKLAYGVANSDQLAMMITCEPGAAEAVVYGPYQPDTPRLTRAAWDETIDPLSGGLVDEARLRLDDPALKGLARAGRMAVAEDGDKAVLTADRTERRLVSDFVAYCSGSRA